MKRINSAINWQLILSTTIIVIKCRKNPKRDDLSAAYYCLYLLHIIQLSLSIIIGYI